MPVVRQPEIQLLQSLLVVKVVGASVQPLSEQVPDAPEAVHVHTLAPDDAALAEIV